MPLIIEMGIGWKSDPDKPGGLVSCTDSDYVAEIERLRDECVSLRLTIEGQREQAAVGKKVIDRLRKALKIAREYVVRIDGTMAFTAPENRTTKPDLDLINAALTN